MYSTERSLQHIREPRDQRAADCVRVSRVLSRNNHQQARNVLSDNGSRSRSAK